MATIYKTLDSVINNSSAYDINKIAFYKKIDDLTVKDTDLFTIYWRYIKQYVGTYTVTDAQRTAYLCKPHLLSQLIYGTPELAWLIMRLNGQECPSKFRLKSYVYIIPLTDLENIYDDIVTRSQTKLQENWNTYL